MKVWVLTEEYNEYDQHGEYYLAAFAKKPTAQQLVDAGVEKHRLEHVLNGGGRKNTEDHWFNLKQEKAL